MKTKIVAITNIFLVIFLGPLFFMALIFGMRSADQPATLLQNVAFTVPLILFFVSIWISGYLFKVHPRLSSISTFIAVLIVGANIYGVVSI